MRQSSLPPVKVVRFFGASVLAGCVADRTSPACTPCMAIEEHLLRRVLRDVGADSVDAAASPRGRLGPMCGGIG